MFRRFSNIFRKYSHQSKWRAYKNIITQQKEKSHIESIKIKRKTAAENFRGGLRDTVLLFGFEDGGEGFTFHRDHLFQIFILRGVRIKGHFKTDTGTAGRT